MSNDLKNFLIGVAVAFLFLFFLGFLIFSGLFVHHLGKVSTENQIASVQNMVVDTKKNTDEIGKEVEKLKVDVADLNKKTDNAITMSAESKNFAETIAKKEPAVKVVYVKPPKKEEKQNPSSFTPDDMSEAVRKGTADLREGMEKLKKNQDELSKKLDDFEEETKNHFYAIEDSVNSILKWKNSTSYTVLGPPKQEQKTWGGNPRTKK